MCAINYRLQVVADGEELTRTAAEILMSKIVETLTTKEFFTIALSGGSTPKKLYSLLAGDTAFREQMPWSQIHFFWGDERHVPPDHEESNYRMTREAMLDRAPVPPENIHRIRAEEPDASKVAKGYEQELRAFFNLGKDQLPRFDCVLLGMGPDGHTASLFPGTGALHEQTQLVVANWVEKFNTYRITMTSPVLNNANTIIFLVSGEEKAEVLQAVLEGEEQPERFPAQLIRPRDGSLLWLVDKTAANTLTQKKE